MKDNETYDYEIVDLEDLEEISVPLHCNNLSSGE
jgi:hypothetical protein